MTKFEVGDRVKVAYEGTVSWAGGSGVDVEYSGGFSWADNDIVTLVERRKPKVGDKVGNADFNRLPVGTVLNYIPLGGRIFKSREGWVKQSTGEIKPVEDFDTVGYTVAYLPD